MKISTLLRPTFIFLFLLPLFSTWSQQPLLTKVLPPEDENWGGVVGMAQDHQGFLWLATKNGLHRYDGYGYVSFYHDPENANSLALNWVEAICVAKSGIIWLGTFGKGLDRFDPVTKNFTHFTHNSSNPASLSNDTITAILEDRQGVLWIGTHGGLHRFHPENGTFTRYQHNPLDSTSLSNDQVRALYEDRKGTLWVGTGSPWESKPGEGGLNRFHPSTNTFTRYLHDPKNSNSLIDNKIRAIFEDSRGTFWIGTLGDGLHTMDRQKETFTRHRHDPHQSERLSRSPVLGGIADGVTFIHEDMAGAIWIGTNGSGMSRFDLETETVEHFVYGTENSRGLLHNDVWWAFTSKDGVLWISTLEGDLYRMDPLQVNFNFQSTKAQVYAFLEDASGKLWVGTGNGLEVYDHIKEDIKDEMEPSIPLSLARNRVLSLLEDRKGILWVGGEEGLWRRDPKTGTFTHFSYDPKMPASLGEGPVVALHEDKEGTLWVGTMNGGLCRMDSKTGTFTRFQPIINKVNSLSHNFVSAIYEDKKGNLWVGTWNGNGLNMLDRKSGTFKQYMQKNNHSISAIREDASGRLWVGCLNKGLYWYEPGKDDFIKFIDENSGKKINFSVKAMVQDEQGKLWVSTSGGLIKIDQEGNLASTYGKESGLDPGALHILAAHKGKTGNLYIGASLGFYNYLFQNMKVNQNPPHIELTDFRLYDELVIPGAQGPLFESLGQANEVLLNHDQNVFSIDFTAIHFTNPSQNRLLYMLENYDEGWRLVKSDYSASYFKVPPGEYIFRVKAASSDGAWAEKALSLIIQPPWWRTWWAYGMYFLLLGGTIFSVDRTQRRRIIHRERERTRERELAQAREIEKAYHELGRKSSELESQKEEMQSTLEHLQATQEQLIQKEKMASLGELTAGIAHEIQNPLNFVNNFSEVSTELVAELREGPIQQLPEKTKEEARAVLADLEQNLQKIHHHGQRADAIVKNMLQHSRTSAGEKQLTNLNALADEYLRLAYHGLRAKDKSFNCTLETDFDQNVKKVEVMPQEIGRVLLNLYNNAFYAVQEKAKLRLVPAGSEREIEAYKPTVTVSTCQLPNNVEIRVRDNGIGMPESVKSKIFQPFFTTKPTGQGTGLGLSLSYDIITKGHEGELKVETKEGEFTELIIVISVTVASSPNYKS